MVIAEVRLVHLTVTARTEVTRWPIRIPVARHYIHRVSNVSFDDIDSVSLQFSIRYTLLLSTLPFARECSNLFVNDSRLWNSSKKAINYVSPYNSVCMHVRQKSVCMCVFEAVHAYTLVTRVGSRRTHL